MNIPSICLNDDMLGRGIFSCRQAKDFRKGNRKNSRTIRAFIPPDGKDEISVDRLDFISDENMTQIADQSSNMREETFCGWAVISVEKAKMNGRDVRPAPKKENPYHANIIFFLPKDKEERKAQQQKHANQLASCTEWRQAKRA